jgi:splicing factor 3A subunit 1
MFETGLAFEKKILANEANNVKFNFLRSTDPYHQYYRFKVSTAGAVHKSTGKCDDGIAIHFRRLLDVLQWPLSVRPYGALKQSKLMPR